MPSKVNVLKVAEHIFKNADEKSMSLRDLYASTGNHFGMKELPLSTKQMIAEHLKELLLMKYEKKCRDDGGLFHMCAKHVTFTHFLLLNHVLGRCWNI
jgi:hypothetical protein